ncbi:hypothetical protein BBK82_38010 [Lentzea guizhouensis]|uniref:Uncharacterized protein n=1 Tax=Lentzea guizhouensis TaxID=1586287 RepID=A0A1B2HT90_9PSEU|nr:hypothetical protein [Lentzea guizhouensis]ANZ40923.1 hypothetical protein BBK82_38010 [Lentzea guizhouensis]
MVEQWCLGRLRPFLTAVPTTPRRFEIYHASLREVLTAATPAPTEEEQAWSGVLGLAVIAANNRIADYCLTSTDGYALRHLPGHLLLADRVGELDALLGRRWRTTTSRPACPGNCTTC